MSFYTRPARSILHPTDFSDASESAFAHALAIAVNNQATLTILHVVRDRSEMVPWHEYPSVRATLQRWGALEPGASRREVAAKLGVTVEKAVGIDANVVNSIVRFTQLHDVDLIVMATSENREQPYWMQKRVSVPVLQKSCLPVLLVPQDVPGCVSSVDGVWRLRQILLPVDHQPTAQPVLERLAWATSGVKSEATQVTLLHVGDGPFPALVPPDVENVQWSSVSVPGDPVTEIIRKAHDIHANLIAMMTTGKTGFWDAVRGSTVQRILKKTPCPVFALPARRTPAS